MYYLRENAPKVLKMILLILFYMGETAFAIAIAINIIGVITNTGENIFFIFLCLCGMLGVLISFLLIFSFCELCENVKLLKDKDYRKELYNDQPT